MNRACPSVSGSIDAPALPEAGAEAGNFPLTQKRRNRFSTIAGIVLVAAAYFASGRFGLSLAFLNASASAVWPPTGLALAALLLRGYGLWPGIFIGAFLVNVTTEGSVGTSLAIACGNTLEALLGAWLVNRFDNGWKAFEHTRDVFRFVLLAAMLSTLVSATIGLIALRIGGFAKAEQAVSVWTTWWVGDVVSNLVIAPLLLIWFTKPLRRLSGRRALEAMAALLTAVGIGYIVFVSKFPFGFRNEPLEYLAIPPLVWAALRFGQRGAAASAAIMSAIAIGGTLRGFGPFAAPDPNKALLLLQAFMGTINLTALMLAAVASERRRAEQRLHVQDAVNRILLDAATLREATPKILQALCKVGGWEFGAIWRVEETQLRCLDTWRMPSSDISEFERITRERTFEPGVGLPGTVWARGKPIWIPDVTRVLNLPRAGHAAKAGLCAAFAFPFKTGDRTLGVIECFSCEVRQPDENFLGMLESIGNQVGQFIERKRSEEALRRTLERLNLALAAADLGDWWWDAETDLVTFSERAAEIFGIPPGPHMTRKQMQSFLHPEDRERARLEVERAIATRTRYDIEYRVRRPDGTELWLAAFGRAVYDAAGRPLGTLGILQDITGRKRADDLLASQARHLETLVEERTASLHEIINELESYSYSISHDMRAPLRAMQGYSQVLIEELGPQLDEANRRYLQRIVTAANRLDQLITDVLSYSRLSRAEIDLKPIDLNRLISELIHQYPALHNEHVEISGDLGIVIGAEALLVQAIANLLTNAVKFVRPGVAAHIKLWSEEIPQAVPGRPLIRLHIQDDGIGVPPEHHAAIFKIFHRAHSEKEYPGTGIGLSIVKKAIERMDGQVGLRSEPGKGSTFWIELRKA